jgi:excinuclease ABC subunit C
LKHFGSALQVQKASLEELQETPGIGKELAEKIFNALRNTE